MLRCIGVCKVMGSDIVQSVQTGLSRAAVQSAREPLSPLLTCLLEHDAPLAVASQSRARII